MRLLLNRAKELLLLASLPLILFATLYILVATFWSFAIVGAALIHIKGLLLLPCLYTLVPTFLWNDLGLAAPHSLPPGALHVLNVGDSLWPDGAWAFVGDGAARAVAAGWPYLLGLCVIWLVAGYRYQALWARVSRGIDMLPPGAAPWAEDDIRVLAEAAHLPVVPRLAIWASEAPNAFASGVDADSYKITLTYGLLTQLNHDEIRAVIAHEMGHIAAGDVRLLTLCYVYGGMFSSIADYLWANIGASLRGDDSTYNRLFFSIPFVMIVALILNLAGGMATLVRMILIRGREYGADRFSRRLTGSGEDLASALGKISQYQAPAPKVRFVRESVIHRPLTHWWQYLTASHPPIPARQKALRRH